MEREAKKIHKFDFYEYGIFDHCVTVMELKWISKLLYVG